MFITSGRIGESKNRNWQNNIQHSKVIPRCVGTRTANEKQADEYKEEPAGCTRFKRFNSLRVFWAKSLQQSQNSALHFECTVTVAMKSARLSTLRIGAIQLRFQDWIPGLCILLLCCSVGGSILKAIIAMNEMRQLPWIILCRHHQVLCPSISSTKHKRYRLVMANPMYLKLSKVQSFYVVPDLLLTSYPPSVRAMLSWGGASDVDQRGTSTAGQETCANHNFATNRWKISEIFVPPGIGETHLNTYHVTVSKDIFCTRTFGHICQTPRRLHWNSSKHSGAAAESHQTWS